MIVPFREDWQDYQCVLWGGSLTQSGYGRVWRDGKTRRVHRVVWTDAFGPVNTDHEVMHACDSPACYALEHLGVGTRQDNATDMVNKLRSAHNNGELSGNSKLTEIQILDIRNRYVKKPYIQGGLTQQQLADEYSVSRSLISMVVNRDIWTHI